MRSSMEKGQILKDLPLSSCFDGSTVGPLESQPSLRSKGFIYRAQIRVNPPADALVLGCR